MSTEIVVFILYFAVVFAIGWMSMRRTHDEADYWIAGGKLGWFVGGATLSATHTSAGTFIGTIGVIYTVGWSFGWLILAIVLAYWFMAAYVAPRFVRVRQLTLPGFIEARYQSKTARAIAAVIILGATTVYIQAQIVAGGLIAQVIFGIDPGIGMIIFTAILLLYTMIGGMIAVAYTDLIQLIIMALGVIVAIPIAIYQFDGFSNMLHAAEIVNPDTFSWKGLPGTLLFTMGLAFFLGSVSTPEKLVRLYAMKDMRTIRRGILFTMILVAGMNLMVFVMGLASISMFPVLPSGDMAMPMLAKTMLPPVIGSLLLAAITSAMMSTVDSLLLVAGSALAEDLYGTFSKKSISQRSKLRIGRIGILITGIVPLVTVLLGIGEGELIQFIVLLFTALMASSFFVPVLGGVWWRRATKEGAIAAMIGGVTTTALWKIFGHANVDPVLPGFICSLFLMIVVSLFTKPNEEKILHEFFG